VSKETQRRVTRVRERDGDDCYFCGRSIDFTIKPPRRWAPTLHHDPPYREVRTNALPNLHLAHARCHRQHHKREAREARDAVIFGEASYWRVTPGRERLPL
jgi:hypothetical protein